MRLPLDELRSEQNAERVSVEGGKGKTVNEREVVDASRRAAELARGRLLDVLFGVGKGRESGPVGFVVDERVVPLKVSSFNYILIFWGYFIFCPFRHSLRGTDEGFYEIRRADA